MLIAVALGGAIGSAARWWLMQLEPATMGSIPWMTLGINVAGSLLLGYLAQLFSAAPASPALAAGLTAGLCGGFTTFSTFSGETWRLIGEGHWIRAGVYAIVSVTLCVAAIGVGVAIARAAHRAA